MENSNQIPTKNKKSNKHILESSQRVCYIFVGKPGVGKTTIADKLAQSIPSVAIAPSKLLSQVLSNESHPDHATFKNLLKNGQKIPAETLLDYVKAKIIHEDTVFKGYILDGIPANLSTLQDDPQSVPEDINALIKIVAEAHPDHIPVLVNLSISDENLMRRRAGQWVDPVTSICYPGQQIEYSRKRRAEGWTDGTPDELALNEQKQESEESNEQEVLELTDEQEKDENIEEDEEQKNLKKKEANPPMRLSNRISWPILSEEIMNRLLKRPEDDPHQIINELKVYSKYEGWIQEIRTKYFDILHVINLDATQHPETVFANLTTKIDTLGFSAHRAPEIKHLNAPDGGFRGLSEPDIYRFWRSAQLEDGEPTRDLSKWGKYCPVTFLESELLSAGLVTECVAYKGFIYFFVNEECRLKFLSNPEKYLMNQNSLKNIQVSILGGPLSGKSTQAKLLAASHGLVYLNGEEILSKLDLESDQKSVLASNPLYANIVAFLKKGGDLPGQLLVELFQRELELQKGGDNANGWVLDGFPKTIEQIEALKTAGLVPNHAFFLKNDINDENVRVRAEIYKANSKNGKSFNEPSCTPSNHSGKAPKPNPTWSPELSIAMYPNFDNMYNGYKEELSLLLKKMDEYKIEVTQAQADNGVLTIFSTLQNTVDPLIPKAVALSPTDIAELTSKIEFGVTKDYCPVALRDKKILQKGTKNNSAKYQSKIYYFATEEARATFLVEPKNYTSQISIPPIRLVTIGPTGSGKTSLIKSITKSFGCIHVLFDDFILEYAEKQNPTTKSEILYMIHENSGLLSPAVITDVLSCLFTQEPFVSKGFILEGFPTSRLQVETMVKNDFYVDAFIHFKASSEVCTKRLLEDYLKKKEDEFKKLGGGTVDEEEALRELMNISDKEQAQVVEVLSTLEALCTIPVLEIDANKYIRSILVSAQKKLSMYLENRSNLFTNPISINRKQADLLIHLGIKTLSPCGKLCPVSIKTSGIITHTSKGKYPIIFGNHLYFVRDADAKKEFFATPSSFVFKSAPKPIVHPTVCIIGPPKSGKTSLAQSISNSMEMVYLTVPEIIKSILQGNETTSLYEKLNKTLRAGNSLSDDDITDAIKLVTSRVTSKGRGWILDGYPNTKEQAEKLDSSGFLPHIMIQIELSLEEALVRSRNDFDESLKDDKTIKKLNVADAIITRFNAFTEKNQDAIVSLFKNKYSNLITLDGTKSKWYLKESLSSNILESIIRQQNYIGAKTTGQAAAIYEIGLNIPIVLANLGKYMDYCPVSFKDKDELQKSHSNMEFMAEYDNQFYCMIGPQQLESFLENPLKYVQGKDLPNALPFRRTKEELKSLFPKQLELKGFCPVTLKQGKPGFESLVLGDHNFVVEHDERLYAMESLEKLEAFMRSPWNYTTLVLPKKLPPVAAPISVPHLPIIGYLEQSVASKLTDALTSLGNYKPKYPFKSLDASASNYLGLYLKAHNPKAKDWVKSKFEKKLNEFKHNCELIKDLGKSIESIGDAYLEPESRPVDLVTNLKKLDSLK